MMSLVAYDSDITDSDECEAEDNITQNNSIEKKYKSRYALSVEEPKSLKNNQVEITNNSIFHALPQPKKDTLISPNYEEVDDEFLKKKEIPMEVPKKKQVAKTVERKPAQIFLPSLANFADDDDEDTEPKFKPSLKGTGLLSLLPQPKATQIAQQCKIKSLNKLIPDVVKNKSITPKQVSNIKKTNVGTKLPLAKYDSSDESDPETSTSDFFSLKETPAVIDDIVDNDFNFNEEKKQVDLKDINEYHTVADQASTVINMPTQADMANSNYVQNVPTVELKHTMDIDDEALQKLCGSRARRKGELMQIIDIDQKEILPDRREWLTKALTEDNSKRMSSSKRRGDEPTTQQRRKHQITYLAHQAKANEQELQNQWANNRLSKKQTQSKYGF